MTENHSGLRFDIYERVRLPDGLAGIQALDEAELIPHIQVFEERDYAVIKGNLWLTGTYTGDEGEPGRELAHLIPVEITMPLSRVQRLEDINVEIEQFDIEMLNSRSLNVTGVLSLHGLELASSSAEQSWDEPDEEETVFVYTPVQSAPEYVPAFSSVERSEGAVAEANEPVVENEANESDQLEPAMHEEVVQSEENPAHTEYTVFAVENEQANVPELVPVYNLSLAEIEPEAEPGSNNAIPTTYAEEPAAESAVPLKRSAEPVVTAGVASHPELTDEKLTAVARLHSLAEASGRWTAAVVETAPIEQYHEDMQWKNLFLRDDELGEFKSMRICIVQKEETIEQIANRYRIQPREIALYNRLSTQQLDEGQIIVIPS
ncbi:LysM peptidoglycan-binding domain-containing protein [Gorillibacterium massiliense]|uniref:LysM peptidoglycan-binding domain-containing protein n=1 Tax=Gorillibacterium massiliense TaxID=1280390 RepID=UPI0004AD6F2A|nr:LysM peptidoglycan-binding domain-containing protein [Gorillibacterium massiliense]